jgi:GNAT superfamily N-acetyltransferase
VSRLEGPRPLFPGDDTSSFRSGEPQIDDWLATRALRAEAARTARTYVVTDRGTGAIAGYYCLSAYSVARGDIGGGRMRRNAPDPVPAILLGRLGVDRSYQGHRLGAALLKDALLRTVGVADIVGARALLVHAISDTVATFYGHYGFQPLPSNTRTPFLPLKQLSSRFGN